MHRWAGGAFELVVSAEILFELQEVLTRPRFRRYVTLEQVRDYVLWLHDQAAAISEELPWDVVRGVTADPDDDYIVGVAYLGQAGLIVPGDPHLTNLDTIRRGDGTLIARVLTPPRLPRRTRSRGVVDLAIEALHISVPALAGKSSTGTTSPLACES